MPSITLNTVGMPENSLNLLNQGWNLFILIHRGAS